jgi:integrase
VRHSAFAACKTFFNSSLVNGRRLQSSTSILSMCSAGENSSWRLATALLNDAFRTLTDLLTVDGATRLTRCKARQHELDVLLNQFAENFQCEAHSITPSLISGYLMNLTLSERSKRNHQDAIKHLNRWLVLHGYLPKGTDWMDGVQKYSKRKRGEVTIYTPDEMNKVMKTAKGWEVAFCSISSFSTIRHSELKRLDWAQVELSDKDGESFIEILPMEGTKSDQRRRLIPVGDNLKAWLRTCQNQSGKVVPVKDSTTLIARIVKRAGVEFKRNALRHSAISYRVAQTADVPRVSDESGNSVQVIRSNYLRRVKPAVAAEWFSIMPPRPVTKRKLVLTAALT